MPGSGNTANVIGCQFFCHAVKRITSLNNLKLKIIFYNRSQNRLTEVSRLTPDKINIFNKRRLAAFVSKPFWVNQHTLQTI